MGKAGIVIGTEVSRLAPNNADWHQLLVICALSETLTSTRTASMTRAPSTTVSCQAFKGQMSEAELHLLKARLRGGRLTKARGASSCCRCRSGTCMPPPGG